VTRVTHARIAITASIVLSKVERAAFANIDYQTFATTELKYWEIAADKLRASGWSWCYCSAVTEDGWRWSLTLIAKAVAATLSTLTNC
jgi:hypothetical protein